MALVACLAWRGPAKFATSLSGGGISLLRDDQELSVYHDRAQYVYDRGWPYRDHRIEYPILGALYVSAPALFARTQAGFTLGMYILNGLAAVALLYVTYRLLVLLSRPVALLWLAFLPGVIYFVLNRFDVWPALLVQLSLLMLFSKRWNWAFILLGASFLAKGYAILLFPIYFVYWYGQSGNEKVSLWRNKPLWLVIGPIIAGVAISVVMAGWQNGLFPYYFQSTRGFAYGSAYTIYLLGLLTIWQERWVDLFIAGATKIMILLQFVIPALMYGGHAFFKKYMRRPDDVITWSSIVLAVYILFSPYYSPQWLLWLIPLLMLWRPVRIGALIVGAYGLLAYLEFPVAINVFGFDSIQYNMLVLVRTVLLVAVMIVAAVLLRRSGSDRESTAMTTQ